MIDIAGEMWLSTRRIRRSGDPEWDDYIQFVGLPHLREVRTIDSWRNPTSKATAWSARSMSYGSSWR